MNDAFGVRGIQRIGNLNTQRQNRVDLLGGPAIRCFRVSPSRNSMAMKALPILLANVVNRADIGMVERRSGLGFTLKTSQSLGVSRNFIGQEFERNKTLKADVLGLVHHTHPTATQFLDDAVVRDGLADQFENSSPRAAIVG